MSLSDRIFSILTFARGWTDIIGHMRNYLKTRKTWTVLNRKSTIVGLDAIGNKSLKTKSTSCQICTSASCLQEGRLQITTPIGTIADYHATKRAPCRRRGLQLVSLDARLPKKYHVIENSKHTSSSIELAFNRYKIIENLMKEINNVIHNFMCRKSLLKLKVILNKTYKVIISNKRVPFKIIM